MIIDLTPIANLLRAWRRRIRTRTAESWLITKLYDRTLVPEDFVRARRYINFVEDTLDG